MREAAGIRLIFGQPQSGKTTRARTLTARCPRVLYYDTAGHDYHAGVICYSLPELRAFWRSVYRGSFRIVYRPVGPTREERRSTRKIDPEFDAVCDLLKSCQEQDGLDNPVTFVVDEVDRYAERGEYDDAFGDLLRRGEGHYGVDLIVATQMPQGIGRLLTALTRTWDIFQTAEAAHVGYFARRCAGVDPMHIRELDRYEYIHYEQGTDSYWICRDDLLTGDTDKTEREYLYDRTWGSAGFADSRNVAPVATVAVQPPDGKADMPSAQAERDSSDGRHSGGQAAGAGPVPSQGHRGS